MSVTVQLLFGQVLALNNEESAMFKGLFSVDFEDDFDSSSDILAYGWTIDTKYYKADVSMWMAHLFNEFSITGVPMFDRVAALVMVFDLNNLSSFSELKKWISCNDIRNFDILLCIGNKADLVPGHSAHVECRRSLAWNGAWSITLNILKLVHQMQGLTNGVERLLGALSAHMWPGMILKSGQTISQPSLPEQEGDSSDEEPNYELEYEILSAGSAEPWDDTDVAWVSATNDSTEPVLNDERQVGGDMQPSTSTSTSQSQNEIDFERAMPEALAPDVANHEGGMHFELEDMEQMMSEIGSMRDNLRLMPDFQRREMAAKLAMKMASMFGDSSGDEGEIE